MNTRSKQTVTKVIVIDDDKVIRDALTEAIGRIDSFRIVGHAGSLAEGLKLLEYVFDVVLVDLNLGDGSGIDIIKKTRLQNPEARIIVISVFGDERNVLSAIEAGADGYLLKDINDNDLIQALERIVAGECPISPSIAGHLLKRVRDTNPQSETLKPQLQLTNREIEILKLLAKGYTYQEVSGYLAISYHTVADHIKNIYKKLAVNSKSQAIFEAAQAGLIQVNDPYHPK